MNQKIESNLGSEMYDLINKLFPICRSITGNGVRKSLAIIKEIIPIKIFEIPTGKKVFDWEIPKEWNIEGGWIKNSKGEKIIDFKKSNLHVMSYSTPIHKKVSLDELKNHLFTIKDHPEWFPYKTSYYKEDWGFCIPYKIYQKLSDDEYEVFIDSSLKNGSLTYGEFFKQGSSDEEVLISCYICHPSLCNDNLSGISLVTFLAKSLEQIDTKFSYRFLFIPETIGAITWLSQNENKINKIKQGFVVTCVGDKGNLTYKKTRLGNSIIDGIVNKVLKESGEPYEIVNFFPYGSDERQFSSPGINLPMGSLMRTPYHKFPQYHTSADNLDLMSKKHLQDSLEKYFKIITYVEKKFNDINQNLNKYSFISNDQKGEFFLNCNPKCEPNLGKRGLYRTINEKNVRIDDIAMFWILNYSDGEHSLKDISELSNIEFKTIKETATLLEIEKLLKHVDKN